MKLEYKECPICEGVLVFRPISTLFDEDGSRFGFRLLCKRCCWYDGDRFYIKEDVKRIMKTKSEVLEVK